MIDWIAQGLLDAGASVAGLFISEDRSEFDRHVDDDLDAVAGAVLRLFVYVRSLVDYLRSVRRPH